MYIDIVKVKKSLSGQHVEEMSFDEQKYTLECLLKQVKETSQEDDVRLAELAAQLYTFSTPIVEGCLEWDETVELHLKAAQVMSNHCLTNIKSYSVVTTLAKGYWKFAKEIARLGGAEECVKERLESAQDLFDCDKVVIPL